MLNFIRWLLVLPAAIGAWCLAMMLGLLAYSALENLCFSELSYNHGGTSCGPWLEPTVTTFGASLAALLVVVFTTLIAPSNRRTVAWTAYLSGSAVATAIFLQDQNNFALPFAGAVIVGFISAAFMQSRKQKSRYGELHLPRH